MTQRDNPRKEEARLMRLKQELIERRKTPPSRFYMASNARKPIWSVFAAARHQLPMCAMALAMGGNVRVGLEDSLFAGKGIRRRATRNR